MGNISQTPFFTDPGVRRQLNLNSSQFNTLNGAYQNAYSRYNQALNNLNSNSNLTADQRAQQMQQLENQFNTQFGNTVNSTLTDTQAQNRFNQLNRQFQGFNAFNDPTIRQQLNLTSDQLSRIRQLSNDFRQQLQQFRRGAGNNLNNVDMTAWNNVWSQYATQLNSVLTPQQQQTWSQLVGQPYTFSPNVFGNGTTSGTTDVTGTGTGTGAPATNARFFPNGSAGRTGGTDTGTVPTGTAGTGTSGTGTAGTGTAGTGTTGTGTTGTGTAGAGGTAGTGTSGSGTTGTSTSGTGTSGTGGTSTATTQGTTTQGSSGTVR